MKISQLIQDLSKKEVFNKFQLEHSDSFLSAFFSILDSEKKIETIQLDFFIPSIQKVAGFEFPFNEYKLFEDKIENMKNLDTDILLDLEDLKKFCEETINKNNSAMSISKIIAVLRDDIWNLTCMDNSLGIVRIKANSKTRELISFSKGSILDIARPVSRK